MEQSSLENQLKKITVLYKTSIIRFLIAASVALFFLYLALPFGPSEWLTQYGAIVMTIAVLCLCNATRHLLKYVKIKQEEATNGK